MNYSLEAQLNYRLEAHKCELGTLTRGTLVTIGSGPNSPPPFKTRRRDTGDEMEKCCNENSKERRERETVTWNECDGWMVLSGWSVL